MKLPQGKSNYGDLVRGEYYYVDKTGYLRQLEDLGNTSLFFLRPRRFGKSLFVNMMMHYYGEQHKGAFEELFGKYDIGRNPTPLANSYLTLFFSFAGIETSTKEGTRKGFLDNVKKGIQEFLFLYRQYWDAENAWKHFEKSGSPVELMKQFFSFVQTRQPGRKIYLFIDEYDHFANELLAFNFQHFKEIVSANGYVRKFYETLKDATFSGLLDRLFITGVTPVTVDSMTSGFNICTNISQHPFFQGMTGFFEEEVRDIMSGVGVTEEKMPGILGDMKFWYDGYLFGEESSQQVYNSNMVLYFAENYRQFQRYPVKMLDINVASDYQKVGSLFRLINPEKNLEVLNELIDQGYSDADVIAQFNFERPWMRDDFVSLLYFLGYLTFAPVRRIPARFVVPNYVIRELYFRYFLDVIVHRAQLNFYSINAGQIGHEIAFLNNAQPLAKLIGDILKGLADRDKVQFDEKYVKSVATAILHMSGIFYIKSEYPVQGGYVDLLMLQRPQNPVHNQVAIELKYLPKKDAKKLGATIEEAKTQLLRYKSDPQLASVERLRCWLLVFVGNEWKLVEEV